MRIPAPPDHAYDVVVGDGCLPQECARLAEAHSNPWVVVVDEAVADGPGAAALAALEQGSGRSVPLRVGGGEVSKSRETLARLQDETIAAGVGRDGRLLAVGGGVVGDLAGFLAATLYRGVPWAVAPTTLLAMVDSAVGGKTGIDTHSGKNLVGAFHQPFAVIADVATLESLPQVEIAAGLSEVIKYGVILDEQLFIDLEDGLLESCGQRVSGALVSVVERCVRLKAEVVAGDERESGRRRILNFGHTVGHAIESASGYGLRHGEAVSLGMVAEARVAASRLGAPADLADRIAELCARAGLPTVLPESVAPQAVLEGARTDKKNLGGEIRCSLPEGVGRMSEGGGSWAVGVDEGDLLRAVESLRGS